MNLGQKIKEARKELGRGWTQEYLSKELAKQGLKKSSNWVAAIEIGRFDPHPNDLKIFSKVLRKPESYFVDSYPLGVDSLPNQYGTHSVADSGMDSLVEVNSYIPVLGVVAADRFVFSFETIPEETLPNPWPGKSVFALRVSGDCMEPATFSL